MAAANVQLIEVLRECAQRLRDGAYYAWGHHGACNCGNLVQVATDLSKEEILRFAHTGTGEWTELATEHCVSTGAPLQEIFSTPAEAGAHHTDMHHIEYLSDRSVLNHLAGGFRWLKHNRREDAVAYFEAFATMLELRLTDTAVQEAAGILAEAGANASALIRTPLLQPA